MFCREFRMSVGESYGDGNAQLRVFYVDAEQPETSVTECKVILQGESYEIKFRTLGQVKAAHKALGKCIEAAEEDEVTAP